MSDDAEYENKNIPANISEEKRRALKINVNRIGNSAKRREVYQKQKAIRKGIKVDERKKRKRERELLGDAAPPPKTQRTIDNTRAHDETYVDVDDEEIQGEEEMDEFASYFKGKATPKLCLTTSVKPAGPVYSFIRELLYVFPNSFFYPRRHFPITRLVEEANENGFTDLLIFNEDHNKVNGLTLVHLPHGPTANFKLSSVRLNKEIEGHATLGHLAKPEIILNRFTTRLGQRVARMLAALFHQEPNFRGRRVMTFHNQRDFVFFRHHRYIFEKVDADNLVKSIRDKESKRKHKRKAKKIGQEERDIADDKTKLMEGETIINDNKIRARIQEVGPQFTMKLRWIQHGVYDSDAGEMEWKKSGEMGNSKRKFYL